VETTHEEPEVTEKVIPILLDKHQPEILDGEDDISSDFIASKSRNKRKRQNNKKHNHLI
jgi:hypothetical protein